MERLYAGWLVKSPPGKKTFGPWRLFKSKWRERYFVLYAPPSSQTIPGCCSAVLCYYDDDNLVKEYGRIDLSRCEEILTQLESDEHHHIFALRIANKDSERTYYLAARSEEEMNQWANCLCCVLRLSGGEGIGFASGFEHLFSYGGEGLRSPTRCSILTQKSGEQRRTSNVPDTISKSATALNIRMAEATSNSSNVSSNSSNVSSNPSNFSSNSSNVSSNISSNFSSNSSTIQESSGGRRGKRQSILSLVVKTAVPATSSMRRPSGPVNPVAQSRFQTMGRTPVQQATANQSLQPSSSSSTALLTPSKPVQKFTPVSPTQAAPYGNVFPRGMQGFAEDDARWGPSGESGAQNFYGPEDDAPGSPPPPMLPDRPLRSPSSAQSKDASFHRQQQQQYGNLSKNEDSGDDDALDPDYVLPRPLYDIDDDTTTTTTNNNNNNENKQRRRTETSDDDNDDDNDYNYPNVHHPISSPNGGLPSPLARGGEAVGEPSCCVEDSYDFLPNCRSRESTSDRTSVTRSSAYSDPLNQGSGGAYDILPLRSFSSSDETGSMSNNRMSGVETGSLVYQNDVFFRRPSGDPFDYPIPLGSVESILPPLPGKKAAPPKEEEGEEARKEKRTSVPFPLSLSSSFSSSSSSRPGRLSAVGPCYINNADVLKAHRSFFGADDDDVYLPMNKSRTTDSVYIQMRSPDAAAAAAAVDSIFGGGDDFDHDRVRDLPSLPHAGQFTGESGNDQTQQSSASLVPIRFTANTRSFRRKEPSRRETLNTKLRISTSGQKENVELRAVESSCPPPIPLKKNNYESSNNNNNNNNNGSSYYVHYATLNLDSALDRYPSPLSSPTSPGSRSCFQTDTLYRQIDPEKTKALCELKKQMDDRQRNFSAKFASER